MSTEKLQKVLARAGLGSRRRMERWIDEGRVRVDGHRALIGDRVAPSARITVDGRKISRRATEPAKRRVIVYHKPAGEVSTRSDPERRPTVFGHLPRLSGGRWIGVGRLDVNTSGLLLFTTDGELANRLMHPRYQLVRDYAVRVYGAVDAGMISRLRTGVDLADGRAAFEVLEPLSESEGANDWYRVRVREGRKREVRRLWESQGVRVSRLIRIRFGPVALPPGLRQGQWRELQTAEVAELCRLVGIAPQQRRMPGRRR